MNKLVKKIICIVIAYFCFATAHAYDVCINGVYYDLHKVNKTAEVTSGIEKYSGTVSIPENIKYRGVTFTVTSIGSRAFYSCTGLSSVSIPNTVTRIGGSAFIYCSGLTAITIPESVTSIGSQAFYQCTGLTSITIPESVTNIEVSVFFGCTGLTSVTIPKSVTNIDGYAFYKCTGLRAITIPESVTNIGSRAFMHCTGLRAISIPGSVTSIGAAAFYECTALTSVIIPKSVTNIGRSAFYGCTFLKDITCHALMPPICDDRVFDYVNTKECILKVPEESVELYKAADEWKDFYNIVGIVSGIDNAAIGAAPEIFVKDGAIYIGGCHETTAVEVYDTNGKCVSNATGSVISGLPHGLYIVKAGKLQKKIVL